MGNQKSSSKIKILSAFVRKTPFFNSLNLITTYTLRKIKYGLYHIQWPSGTGIVLVCHVN